MPPQKEKRRSGDIGRGNDLEKLAQKIKKNVGDIPPRWVPGIVAALVAIFAWSAWEPPPPPVLLVEGPVEGDATLYTGYYKLDTKRRVHGSPAWRHATRPDLFLSRDSVGAWKGGTEQGLERDLGFLRLRDRAAVFPSSRSIVDWEWHSGQDGAWVHEPALTCDEAELPQAPTVLLLEGGALTGAAAKYLGYYELQPEREVNGSPAWRHSEHNDLWIARAPNGNWSAPPPAARAARARAAASHARPRRPAYARFAAAARSGAAAARARRPERAHPAAGPLVPPPVLVVGRPLGVGRRQAMAHGARTQGVLPVAEIRSR